MRLPLSEQDVHWQPAVRFPDTGADAVPEPGRSSPVRADPVRSNRIAADRSWKAFPLHYIEKRVQGIEHSGAIWCVGDNYLRCGVVEGNKTPYPFLLSDLIEASEEWQGLKPDSFGSLCRPG